MAKNANYLILGDGRKVRVLFNMNVLESLSRESGIAANDLDQIRNNIALLRKLLYHCIREGELADRRNFNLDEISCGRLMSIPAITRFSDIMGRLLSAETEESSRPRRRWAIKLW